MNEIRKSVMTVNGNSLHLSMPIAKVDKNERFVSGYATLDNIDSQGDIVLAEASAKAFARARGNIREMHQPIAVGKMVDFREDEFFHTDPDTGEGKFYRGIFVTAHVSEGAEDTWKKVLDGTLTGFSIGGEINEATHEFVKEANGGAGAKVRFIKDYDLVELSLVDNPANQLANVLSIQKSASGDVVVKMGAVVDALVENVFICKTDETVVVKSTETQECPMCGNKMENAGWFEHGPDRAEKVQSIVSKFLTPTEKEAALISNSEGGVDVAKSNEGVEETSSEVSSPNPHEAQEAGDENAVATVEEEAEQAEDVDETSEEEEEAETPEEVIDEETEISKKIDDLRDAIKSSLEESKSETLEKVASLEEILTSTREEFMSKASELESKIEGYGEQIKTQKSRLAELEATLNKVNSADAFRKSADVQRPAETTVQKENFWGNAFSDGR